MNFINEFFGSTDHEQLNTGICVPPNSFGHQMLKKYTETVAADLAVELPVVDHHDKDLGGDPYRTAQLASASSQQWVENEDNRYVDMRAVFHVASLGGTGYPAHRMAGIPTDIDTVHTNIEVLLGSDDVAFGLSPSPQQTIAQVIGYSFLEPGTVLLSNRSDRLSRPRVARETAAMVSTLAREDLADLDKFYWTARYDSVDPAQKALSKADLGAIINGHLDDTPWFDPEDWTWWDHDTTVALDDEPRAVLVVPEGYEELDIGGKHSSAVQFNAAPVDEIHMATLWKLNRPWVQELQRGSVDWLAEQIRDGDNKYAELWAGYARENGYRNPVAAFEEYRSMHFPTEDIPKMGMQKTLDNVEG